MGCCQYFGLTNIIFCCMMNIIAVIPDAVERAPVGHPAGGLARLLPGYVGTGCHQ